MTTVTHDIADIAHSPIKIGLLKIDLFEDDRIDGDEDSVLLFFWRLFWKKLYYYKNIVQELFIRL